MTRAERTRYPEQFTQIGQDTLLKEIKASQQSNLPMQLNYQVLFTEERVPIHMETDLVPVRMAHTWKDHIVRMIEHMTDPFLEIPEYYRQYVLSIYGDTDYPEQSWDVGAELESIGLYLETQQSS